MPQMDGEIFPEMKIVLYSLCGSFTKVDVDSFKASLFLCYIHSNCKFYTIDGIHKIWEWNNIITCPLFNRKIIVILFLNSFSNQVKRVY